MASILDYLFLNQNLATNAPPGSLMTPGLLYRKPPQPSLPMMPQRPAPVPPNPPAMPNMPMVPRGGAREAAAQYPQVANLGAKVPIPPVRPQATPIASAQQDEANAPPGFLQNNSNMLLGLGMGMLSGQGNRDAFARGLQGFVQGSAVDIEQRKARAEEEANQRRKDALRTFLAPMVQQNPALAQLIAEDPEAMKKAISASIDNWFKPPEQAKDEFNRNVDRLQQLEAAGKGGSQEAQYLRKRLEKQTEIPGGFSMTFDEGGIESLTFGGKGTALTPAQAYEKKAAYDQYNIITNRIDEVISDIEEKRGRAGVLGSIKNFTQDVLGIVNDLAPDEFRKTLGTFIETQLKDVGVPPEMAQNMSQFFDPALPDIDVKLNSIALALAKLRIEAGGGDIRAIKDAFDKAREDVSTRGFFSERKALEKLKQVRREIQQEQEALTRRIPSVGTPEGMKPADISPEEWRVMTPEERALFQ